MESLTWVYVRNKKKQTNIVLQIMLFRVGKALVLNINQSTVPCNPFDNCQSAVRTADYSVLFISKSYEGNVWRAKCSLNY